MGFAIPKIQYKNVDTTGTTTSGSGTISAIPDTTDIEVGMFVRGTGIPTGSVVLSKTTSEIVLDDSVLATASGTGVTLAFGFEIEFDFPPEEETGEILDPKFTQSESLSGIRQVSLNFVEVNRKLTFSFLSQSIYVLLKTFLEDWGCLGESFRYYEDKTLTSYVEYELDKLKITPKKIASRGVDTYVWRVPLDFRRVL